MKKTLIIIIPIFLLILMDQIAKNIVLNTIKITGEIPLIKNVFHLQYLENRGAAFGILQNKVIFLVILSIVIATILFIGLYKIPFNRHYSMLILSLMLIGSGAIGNMIDRLYRGFVVDFLYFKLINFPIFNVADCYVVVGAILAIILLLFVYNEEDLNKIFHKDTEEIAEDE